MCVCMCMYKLPAKYTFGEGIWAIKSAIGCARIFKFFTCIVIALWRAWLLSEALLCASSYFLASLVRSVATIDGGLLPTAS